MLDPLLARVGVLSTRQIHALGWLKHECDVAVRTGRLVRIRRGWYALRDAAPEVVAAVRSGGAVSCADALRLRGVWIPEALGTGHVRAAPHLRGQRGRCAPYGAPPPIAAAVDDVGAAFGCLLRCGGAEDIVVVADSLLHLGLATRPELVRWANDAPRRCRAFLERVDAAESGLESIVRFRLRSRRVRVRTQVRIGRHRVDLVVGDRLVIECDGREHHGSWETHAADRARDRTLTAAGYLVVRLTYRQILDDWDAVEQDLLALIRRGAHRAPRRRIHG